MTDGWKYCIVLILWQPDGFHSMVQSCIKKNQTWIIYINIKHREINIQNYVSWLAGQTSMGARLTYHSLPHSHNYRLLCGALYREQYKRTDLTRFTQQLFLGVIIMTITQTNLKIILKLNWNHVQNTEVCKSPSAIYAVFFPVLNTPLTSTY